MNYGRQILFESLEPRQFLDGSVSAVVARTQLTILGDAANNVITVTQDANLVKIQPDATTSVNGKAPGVAVILNIPRLQTLAVDLGGGDDQFYVAPGRYTAFQEEPFRVEWISISGGPGDDTIGLYGLETRRVEVFGGAGKNNFTLASWDGMHVSFATRIATHVTYTGGDEADRVDINGAVINGSVTVNLGGGNNILNVQTLKGGIGQNLNFPLTIGGSLTVSAGNGDDLVSFQDRDRVGNLIIHGLVTIDLGAGYDSIIVLAAPVSQATLYVGGNFSVKAGSLFAEMSNLIIGKDLLLSTTQGNSTVNLGTIRAGRDLKVSLLGSGRNVLYLSGAEVGRQFYVAMTGSNATAFVGTTNATHGTLLAGAPVSTFYNLGKLKFTYSPYVEGFTVV